MDPDSSVNSPRIHWESNVLSYEPGYEKEKVDLIDDLDLYEIIKYKGNNMFFGGVHAVYMDRDWKLTGAGDRRREGIVLKC